MVLLMWFFLNFQSYQESDILEAGPTADFQWIDLENLTEFRACRNSIQGALLIVDERGENSVKVFSCMMYPH